MQKALKIIGAVIVCEAAGIIGATFTAPAALVWYRTLAAPALMPPAAVFAPIWTILYFLMGIALGLVWAQAGDGGETRRKAKTAYVFFWIQIVLNVLWSALFFGLRDPRSAFIDLALLWIFIIAAMIAFARVSKPAAWLLAPYLLWVSFAGYLNGAIAFAPPVVPAAATATSAASSSAAMAGWQTATDSSNGLSFEYPPKLPTDYIAPVDWPPVVTAYVTPYSCAGNGSTSAASLTSEKNVDGRLYCATLESEISAGSLVTAYTYVFPAAETNLPNATGTISFAFSVEAQNCELLDDPQKSACENALSDFSMETVVDEMAQSLTRM